LRLLDKSCNVESSNDIEVRPRFKPMEQQPIQPIAENLWWMIPGKLAGVRKPTAEELTELQKVKAR